MSHLLTWRGGVCDLYSIQQQGGDQDVSASLLGAIIVSIVTYSHWFRGRGATDEDYTLPLQVEKNSPNTLSVDNTKKLIAANGLPSEPPAPTTRLTHCVQGTKCLREHHNYDTHLFYGGLLTC